MHGRLITGKLQAIITPTSSLNAFLLVKGSVTTIMRARIKLRIALKRKVAASNQVHFVSNLWNVRLVPFSIKCASILST